VPFPSPGNVTVARLALKTTSPGTPRLVVANGRRALAAGVVVAATVVRGAGPGRFSAILAVIYPKNDVGPAPASPSPRAVSIVLPAGVSLAGPVRVARNVVYQNAAPPFGLLAGGTASVLASASPPKLTTAQIVRDAQLLALDRSVPLADMGLLRLPFVAAQFGPLGTTLRVSIGVTQLGPINAVEVRFPAGIKVVDASGPPGTTILPMGAAVQFVDATGSFQDGLAYEFKVELSRAPRKAESVIVRASTHYFESALPITERFVLG
jgi:hypothetical protein